MTRVPKFRAWYGIEMYDDPVIHNGEFYLDWRDFEDGKTYDGAVLMQSTGLKDKNGVAVYEGDVVTFEDADDIENIYFNQGVIEWCQGGFTITNRTTVEMDDLLDGDTLEVIVIGNVYENKEFLE